MKTVRAYKEENINTKYSNLPTDEIEGLKSIISRVDNNELKIIDTDKSKKFSINTPAEYVEDMGVHLKKLKLCIVNSLIIQ